MMKNLMIGLTILALCLGVGAYAQDEEQSRNLYLARVKSPKQGRPGAKVRIELLRDKKQGFVPVDTAFRAGDKVKFHFAVNFPAYVAVINLGSSGQLQTLFPYRGVEERVAATKDYVIPNDDDLWFVFDDRPGEERLSFIFSSLPISAAQRPVTVNSTQEELKSLNDEALGKGRDLKLTQVSPEESYVVSADEQVRRPVGFTVRLRHR